MSFEQEARFAKKMRTFLGLFWLGALLLGAGLVAMFVLKPLAEHINVITIVACSGFGAMAIASVGRAACRCPKCDQPFCGRFGEDGGGSGNILASSCKHCGFHPERTLT